MNDQMFRTNSSSEYIARAAKVITLVDLAGHERYFKTTAYGLTGHLPDYACLIVGANAGACLPLPQAQNTRFQTPGSNPQVQNSRLRILRTNPRLKMTIINA